MVIKSLDHFLSVTDPVGFLRVSQGMKNPSQMKTFHSKPFVQVGNNGLLRDPQGSRKSASCCMWVSIKAINTKFIEIGWSSGPLLIGNIFSASPNLPHPKKPEFFSSQSCGRHFVGDQEFPSAGCPL
jgi:hypothetical protein